MSVSDLPKQEVQSTEYRKRSLIRMSDNPDRNIKNENSSPQLSTYFKRHMTFRNAD
jgi:hypothetical protein